MSVGRLISMKTAAFCALVLMSVTPNGAHASEAYLCEQVFKLHAAKINRIEEIRKSPSGDVAKVSKILAILKTMRSIPQNPSAVLMPEGGSFYERAVQIIKARADDKNEDDEELTNEWLMQMTASDLGLSLNQTLPYERINEENQTVVEIKRAFKNLKAVEKSQAGKIVDFTARAQANAGFRSALRHAYELIDSYRFDSPYSGMDREMIQFRVDDLLKADPRILALPHTQFRALMNEMTSESKIPTEDIANLFFRRLTTSENQRTLDRF